MDLILLGILDLGLIIKLILEIKMYKKYTSLISKIKRENFELRCENDILNEYKKSSESSFKWMKEVFESNNYTNEKLMLRKIKEILDARQSQI